MNKLYIYHSAQGFVFRGDGGHVKAHPYSARNYLCLQMKKITFFFSDTAGLSIEGKELIDTQESYIISSLWQSKSGEFTIESRGAMLSACCYSFLVI